MFFCSIEEGRLERLRAVWLLALCLALPTESRTVLAQVPSDVAPDWHLQDPVTSPYVGTGVAQAWKQLDRMVPKRIVTVAVIDDGTEITHSDLQHGIWENLNEEPFNGIDEDGNGYVDDVYGWNFLADSAGDVIYYARYESAWAVALADSLMANSEPLPSWLSEEALATARAQVEELREEEYYGRLLGFWGYELGETFEEAMGRELKSLEEVLYWKKRLGLARSDVKLVKSFVEDEYTFEDLMDALDNFINFQEYHLNPSFFPRSPEEPASGYGNVYCAASSSDHGTHVSGIIAASRDNDSGIQGIAGGVCQVMPLRAVPDGDELDKDVANAIRYAVDNGAKVINMSFGKPLSPDRPLVLAAMRHAAENDVLMVHAAGNDAKNTDLFPSHPNPGSDPVVGSCFLSVGASTAFRDEALVASFSNYGATTVDLFAPGDEILSLANDDGTMWMGGTSMAAPVVTGVATLIRAYFPQFSASEVKQILMNSVFQPEGEFFLPGGEGETVPFSALCKSGGVVNAQQAITIAMVQASPDGK